VIPIFHRRGLENGALKVRVQDSGIPSNHRRPQGQGWAMDDEGYSYVTFTRPTSPHFYQGIALKNGAMYVSTTTSDDDYWSNGLRIGRDGALRVGTPSGHSQGLQVIGGKVSVAGLTFFAPLADKGSGEVDLTILGTGSATFTRATTATTVNSAGLIIPVGSGVARSYYDPTTLQYMGYVAESAATNLVLNSLIDGTDFNTQSVTVSAVAYTLSFYGTGTITLSGVSTAGPLVGTGVYPQRVQLTFTPTAGSLTLTVSGSCKYVLLQTGTFAGTFIPTAGASVTRNADVLTYAFAGNADTTQGTCLATLGTFWSAAFPASCAIASDSGGGLNYALGQRNATGSTNIDIRDGTNAVQKTSLTDMLNTPRLRGSSWGAAGMSSTGDGAAPATGSFDGALFAGTTTLNIGCGGNTNQWNGTIKDVAIYGSQFTNTQLVDATA
jgi:hypothetical protein